MQWGEVEKVHSVSRQDLFYLNMQHLSERKHSHRQEPKQLKHHMIVNVMVKAAERDHRVALLDHQFVALTSGMPN